MVWLTMPCNTLAGCWVWPKGQTSVLLRIASLCETKYSLSFLCRIWNNYSAVWLCSTLTKSTGYEGEGATFWALYVNYRNTLAVSFWHHGSLSPWEKKKNTTATTTKKNPTNPQQIRGRSSILKAWFIYNNENDGKWVLCIFKPASKG